MIIFRKIRSKADEYDFSKILSLSVRSPQFRVPREPQRFHVKDGSGVEMPKETRQARIAAAVTGAGRDQPESFRLLCGGVLFDGVRVLKPGELHREAFLEVAHHPPWDLAEGDEAADFGAVWCGNARAGQ